MEVQTEAGNKDKQKGKRKAGKVLIVEKDKQSGKQKGKQKGKQLEATRLDGGEQRASPREHSRRRRVNRLLHRAPLVPIRIGGMRTGGIRIGGTRIGGTQIGGTQDRIGGARIGTDPIPISRGRIRGAGEGRYGVVGALLGRRRGRALVG